MTTRDDSLPPSPRPSNGLETARSVRPCGVPSRVSSSPSSPVHRWRWTCRTAGRIGSSNAPPQSPPWIASPRTASTPARISHQLPAAAANLLAEAGRTPSSHFDGEARSEGSAMPSVSFGPCGPLPRHLGPLATKVGEKSGLAEQQPAPKSQSRSTRTPLVLPLSGYRLGSAASESAPPQSTATSIHNRQWSPGPHSPTPLSARTCTRSWKPREVNASRPMLRHRSVDTSPGRHPLSASRRAEASAAFGRSFRRWYRGSQSAAGLDD